MSKWGCTWKWAQCQWLESLCIVSLFSSLANLQPLSLLRLSEVLCCHRFRWHHYTMSTTWLCQRQIKKWLWKSIRMETFVGASVGTQLWGDDFIQVEIRPNSTMHNKKHPSRGAHYGLEWWSSAWRTGKNIMSCKVLLWCTKAVAKGYEPNSNWDFQLMFLRPVQV